MPNLLPCPLCGSTDVELDAVDAEVHPIYAGEWMIRCNDCGIELGSFANKATCVKRWNERNDCPEAKP